VAGNAGAHITVAIARRVGCGASLQLLDELQGTERHNPGETHQTNGVAWLQASASALLALRAVLECRLCCRLGPQAMLTEAGSTVRRWIWSQPICT
jgi:hypothetical protein